MTLSGPGALPFGRFLIICCTWRGEVEICFVESGVLGLGGPYFTYWSNGDFMW